MSIWDNFSNDQKNEYVKYLQVYGALTNLFRQKKGNLIPYLDSKYQETIFAKSFNCQIVDIGNTPHDILSNINNKRIGIGLKTWMGNKPTFQKVMQLKRYKDEINLYDKKEDLAYIISKIRNDRLKSDYIRLGLDNNSNIYHYVTREKSTFRLYECAYPLIDIRNLSDFEYTKTSLSWTDGLKKYKYTFGDSQIWQQFNSQLEENLLLDKVDIKIIEDPFSFLLDAYLNIIEKEEDKANNIEEAYLPLYSYRHQEVGEKSGLNAWNGAPKNKGSNKPRPLNEVYIPIPIEFHKKCPNFFTNDIFKLIENRKKYKKSENNKPEIRFHINLPNGQRIPGLITGDNMKNFQSGSNTEMDDNGKRYGQNALGQWLLIDVLGLDERKKVTRDWLAKKGTDSVRIWRDKDDYSNINIDFAPIGSFEAFMNEEPIDENDLQ